MRYSTAGFLAGIFMLPFVLLTMACRWLRGTSTAKLDVRKCAKVLAYSVAGFFGAIMVAGLICTAAVHL